MPLKKNLVTQAKMLRGLACSRLMKCSAVSAALSLCACTHSVNVVHSDLSDKQDPIADIFNTRVVVQSPPVQDKDRYKSLGVIAVGLHNRWDIDFASTTPEAVAEVLRQNFANVVVEPEYRKECSGCGMIVRPNVTDFDFNKLTMQATIRMNVDIYDAYGGFVTSFPIKGKSPITSLSRVGALTAGYFVPFSSTVLGKPVVNASVKSALDDALEKMTERFAAETQAGGQLARVWRPRKAEYGEHEYVAEQTARKMGCDLQTDGIQLTSSHYGKEEYEAYCFSPGRFKISCELGRCQADISPQRNVVLKAAPSDFVN